MRVYEVYKVTFPNNKVYIGMTSIGLKERKRKHFTDANNKVNRKMPNALNKYKGQETWEILIGNLTQKEAEIEEIRLIKSYNSFGEGGYNLNLGGGSNKGYVTSEATKRKISLANKGNTLTKEQRKKLSKALKGRKRSQKHCKAISEAKKGMVSPNKGKPMSESQKDKISKTKRKTNFKFSVHTKDEKFVGIWSNISKCARDLNIKREYVRGCVNKPHKHKSAKGYIFEEMK